MKVWDENENFQELLKKDADITSQLSAAEIESVFTLDTYLRNIDTIFERVFDGGSRPGAQTSCLPQRA